MECLPLLSCISLFVWIWTIFPWVIAIIVLCLDFPSWYGSHCLLSHRRRYSWHILQVCFALLQGSCTPIDHCVTVTVTLWQLNLLARLAYFNPVITIPWWKAKLGIVASTPLQTVGRLRLQLFDHRMTCRRLNLDCEDFASKVSLFLTMFEL